MRGVILTLLLGGVLVAPGAAQETQQPERPKVIDNKPKPESAVPQ